MSKRKPNKRSPKQREKAQQKEKGNPNASRKTSSKAPATKKASKTNTTTYRNIQPTDIISLVIPCYNEESRVSLLVNGIKQFDQKWGKEYELIIVDDGSQDNTVKLLEEKLSDLSSTTNFEILQLESNQGKGNALKAGVEHATGDFVLTLDADMATSPMELKNWLGELDSNSFNKDEILIGSREHSKSKVKGKGTRAVGLMFNFVTQLFTNLTALDTQCGFKLYPIDIAKNLFANMKVKGWAHDVELLYKGQLQGTKVKTMPVTWKHVDESKINVLKDGIMMVFVTIFTAWRIKLDWFVLQPLKELKEKNLTGEHSIYRLLFAVLTVLLLIMMPMLSSDYGITGDEHAQKVYGELIDKHFESDGTYKATAEEYGTKYKDQNALTMTPNLWLYGGLFDFVATKLYNTFGTDPYSTRHWFNALIGFFLMFFTGLLAKEISGSWKVAFLALLMIAVSPRIFGHSMNNPKDIPFAAAYIFTLLHLIRFVKQLPRPGAKTIFALILGIGFSIGIRIGGLLLVAYLGLFTGIAFLWEKHLRKELTNIGTLGRITFYGVAIAFFGYLLGLANWPYGLQDWIANPMEALAEMSNFDYGIQMMYNGEHLWSDELPWYYIPKWILMTAPIAALLGAVLFLPVFFGNKKKQLLVVGLTIFALIFPIAYAVYQGSALYDGLRHFLFVYPILIVLGAYGWGHLTSWIPNKAVGYASIAIPVLLLVLPTMWMMNNHPYQYTYVNELYGGTKGAEAKYETDYWMISVKQLCEWFAENIPEASDTTADKKVTIMMSSHVDAARHYMKKLAPNTRVMWQRYPERDKDDSWDYAIFFARFRNVGHLESGAWMGYETLHVEEVDGVPIGAVLKKGNSQAGVAKKLMQQGQVDTAITLLLQEVQNYPKNEVAWLSLANAYNRKGDFKNMDKAVNGALRLSDSHVNTLAMKGLRYYSEFERTRNTAPNLQLLDSAAIYYQKSVDVNYKFFQGYYYLAICYGNKQDYKRVMENVELFGMNNGNIAQAYDLGIQAAQRMNDQIRLKYFQARKAMTAQNYQQALQLSTEISRINPKYEPGAKLKIFFDDLLAKQAKNTTAPAQ